MRCGVMSAECALRVCTGVRKNALMVLTHLILNDMMKVKGHIARMAMCLQVQPLSWSCPVNTPLQKLSFPLGQTHVQQPSLGHMPSARVHSDVTGVRACLVHSLGAVAPQ